MVGAPRTQPILETERLVFHPFTSDDVGLLFDLHSDPEVQRHMSPEFGGPDPISHEIARRKLDGLVREQQLVGFSKWKAYLRDGTFVGRAGVSRFSPPGLTGAPGHEIGYAFKRAWWGFGLATEAARGVRDWFFDNTDHQHLIGFTTPENEASQRVLMKIGMAPLGIRDLGLEAPVALFRMERPRLAPTRD